MASKARSNGLTGMIRLQGEVAADVESRTQVLKVMRGAMSLLTMVAAVLPDAAAEHLEVILQVLALHTLLSNSCLKREREREREIFAYLSCS